MVFGKLFAFFREANQKLLHLQVFQVIEQITEHTPEG